MDAVDLHDLTPQQWGCVLNGINEALEELDDRQFEARTGVTRDGARSLHHEVDMICRTSRELSIAQAQQTTACLELTLHMVEDWEFETRVGATKAELASLIEHLESAGVRDDD